MPNLETDRIKGMHCEHCYARVHNVLNSIDGVSAKVNGRKDIEDQVDIWLAKTNKIRREK